MHTSANQKVNGAVREVEPWLEKMARVGYAAKGLVYILIGTLAIIPLAGDGRGEAQSQQNVVDTIARQPFGTFLLVAIGVGLFGYSIWRIVQAAYNPEGKKAFKRVVYVISALVYGALGLLCFKAVGGEQVSSGNPNTEQVNTTARLMDQPFGQLLVFALAAVFVGVAAAQFVNAWKTEYKKILRWGEMSEPERSTAVAAGKMGLFSRGVVFLIIAWFLFQAAVANDPSRAKGFAGALTSVLDEPYGPYLFGLLALGMIAFGIYMFILAKYRRMVSVEGGASAA